MSIVSVYALARATSTVSTTSVKRQTSLLASYGETWGRLWRTSKNKPTEPTSAQPWSTHQPCGILTSKIRCPKLRWCRDRLLGLLCLTTTQGTVYLGCSVISSGNLSVNAKLTTKSSCSTASPMVLLWFHQTHHTVSFQPVTPPETTLFGSDDSIVESNPTSIPSSDSYIIHNHHGLAVLCNSLLYSQKV